MIRHLPPKYCQRQHHTGHTELLQLRDLPESPPHIDHTEHTGLIELRHLTDLIEVRDLIEHTERLLRTGRIVHTDLDLVLGHLL